MTYHRPDTCRIDAQRAANDTGEPFAILQYQFDQYDYCRADNVRGTDRNRVIETVKPQPGARP